MWQIYGTRREIDSLSKIISIPPSKCNIKYPQNEDNSKNVLCLNSTHVHEIVSINAVSSSCGLPEWRNTNTCKVDEEIVHQGPQYDVSVHRKVFFI